MEWFYIEFYDIVFKIYAEKKMFEKSFYCLLKKECVKEPNYIIRFCGFVERDIVEELCVGEAIANYKGNKYYSYITSKGEILKISIDSEFGAHMIKWKGNLFDIYNIGKDNGAVWTVRICQDLIITEMIKKGFIPVHASAVDYNNKGILIFGNKGDGKSTTMFSFVDERYNIISNDLVFLGRDSDSKWMIVGWPWKVTIGNSLLNKTNYKQLIDNSNFKTQFYPREFCETFNCQWVWESKLNMIVHPHLVIDRKLFFCKLFGKEAKKELLEMGIEYKSINCIFTEKKIEPQFEMIFELIVKDYPIYKVCGDIWDNRKAMVNFVDENI